MWADKGQDTNKDLSKLAEELPDIILKSRADSTVKSYSYAFNKWATWATKYDMKPIEADPYHISLYLVHLSHTCSSSAPITSAVSAISWAHRMAGSSDPTQMPLVKYTSEGLKRSLAKPIEKKEPITSAILRDIVDMQLKQFSEITIADLSSLGTVAMCLLAYTGFLRFNELVSIRLSYITFNQQGLKLLIPSSKTDIYILY